MKNRGTKLEEAVVIRTHYGEAIKQAYDLYCESEEIAAYLVLEIFRLAHLTKRSPDEAEELRQRMQDHSEMLARTKENMCFILDRIQQLARDRDKYLADIYMSKKMIDVEERLNNLTPWIKDLEYEVRTQAETARTSARLSTEMAKAVR